PVAARHVLLAGRRAPVRRRSRQDVMPIRLVAAAVDDLALLAQGRVLADLVVLAVEIVDRLGDHDSLGVLPGTVADTIARVDGLGAVARLGAEVGAPRALAHARRCRERLAVLVRARDPAQVGPVADADARYEERHIGRLRGGDADC